MPTQWEVNKVYLNTKIFAKVLRVPAHQLVRQIRIPERSESAEAETVPGLLHSAGILDHLLILFAIHVQEFDLFAILGNLEVIQVPQFFFGKEDDRFFKVTLNFGRYVLMVSSWQYPLRMADSAKRNPTTSTVRAFGTSPNYRVRENCRYGKNIIFAISIF